MLHDVSNYVDNMNVCATPFRDFYKSLELDIASASLLLVVVATFSGTTSRSAFSASAFAGRCASSQLGWHAQT